MGRPVDPNKVPTFLTSADDAVMDRTGYRKDLQDSPITAIAARTKVK